MTTRPPRSRPGFTLVEVVIAAALASLLLLAVSRLFSLGTRAARRVDLLADTTDTVGGALVQLTRRIRYAQTLEVPAPGDRRDRLEFSDIETGTWTVTVEGGELILQEKIGFTRRVLARDLHAAHFERDVGLPQLVYLTLEIEEGRGVQRYHSAIYARGSRRADR